MILILSEAYIINNRANLFWQALSSLTPSKFSNVEPYLNILWTRQKKVQCSLRSNKKFLFIVGHCFQKWQWNHKFSLKSWPFRCSTCTDYSGAAWLDFKNEETVLWLVALTLPFCRIEHECVRYDTLRDQYTI